MECSLSESDCFTLSWFTEKFGFEFWFGTEYGTACKCLCSWCELEQEAQLYITNNARWSHSYYWTL